MNVAGLICALCALLSGACGPEHFDWVEDDYRAIYEVTLRSLREKLDVDTLVVDPRPRFLIESNGSFGMGDFSDFPEPLLAETLRADTMVVICRLDMASDCDVPGHGQRVSVSEVYPIGPRDAGLLASSLDIRSDPVRVRGFALRLRSTRDRWTVVSLESRDMAPTRSGR